MVSAAFLMTHQQYHEKRKVHRTDAKAASGVIGLAMTFQRARASETILVGGTVVAVLDIANAMTFWAIYRGTAPQAILQSIAAGLLGNDAFSGDWPTALLGACLHLFIACCIAGVYWVSAVRWPILIRRPYSSGMTYGVVVYLVMNFAVLPLSEARHLPFIFVWFLDNFIGHILLVGLPVALVARWSASRAR